MTPFYLALLKNPPFLLDHSIGSPNRGKWSHSELMALFLTFFPLEFRGFLLLDPRVCS